LPDIEFLLGSALDESEITRWLFRFSLFSAQGQNQAGRFRRVPSGLRTETLSPALALFAFFKPLFDATLIRHESIGAWRSARVGTVSRIAALLSRGDVESAVQVARHSYHAVGVELADFDCRFAVRNVTHLLAALAVPAERNQIATIFQRWRAPAKLHQRKGTQV
jgi:CRISPR-associated protein Csx17